MGNTIVKNFGWPGPSGLHPRDKQYPNDLSSELDLNSYFPGILLRVYDVSTGGTYVPYYWMGLAPQILNVDK